MRHYDRAAIDGMDKLYRINLINSCSGYKSANLLGRISPEGVHKVAIFSSVVHMGSNPPILGFLLRPTSVPRHTYTNLKAYGHFTINHVHEDIASEAHHTSAKYEEHVSEYEKTGLQWEFKHDFPAPFVKGSPVQMGMRYEEEYPIEINGTLLVVASIQQLYLREDLLTDDGFVQLSKGGVLAINGLDGYALPKLIDRFGYARPNREVISLTGVET